MGEQVGLSGLVAEDGGLPSGFGLAINVGLSLGDASALALGGFALGGLGGGGGVGSAF